MLMESSTRGLNPAELWELYNERTQIFRSDIFTLVNIDGEQAVSSCIILQLGISQLLNPDFDYTRAVDDFAENGGRQTLKHFTLFATRSRYNLDVSCYERHIEVRLNYGHGRNITPGYRLGALFKLYEQLVETYASALIHILAPKGHKCPIVIRLRDPPDA